MPMTPKGVTRLLVVHGFITLSAGIVLAVAPGLIPSAVGIRLEPRAYLVAYLLAGAEIGFAVLSFGGSRTTDARTLRLVVWSCIAFHGSSAALETYAYIRGLDALILGNVVARLVIVALFAYALSGLRSSPSFAAAANTNQTGRE
jgi:hypothetical protein